MLHGDFLTTTSSLAFSPTLTDLPSTLLSSLTNLLWVCDLWWLGIGLWVVGCGLLGFEGCFIGWSWVVVDGGRGFLWLVVLQGYGGGIVWWCMRERQREG